MRSSELGHDAPAALREMLGYLNLSSGAPDERFQRRLNELYGQLETEFSDAGPPWVLLRELLSAELAALAGASAAFADVSQAQAVIDLAFGSLLTAYRQHHKELLFHQPDAELFRPLFLAGVCEAVLSQGPPWSDSERLIRGSLKQLNDFIGYRPVAVLRTSQQIEPYRHEWVRPIPVYIRGAGIGVGRYQPIVAHTLAILEGADPELLDRAHFDPALLDELAIDPRAYDFDHPVHKRPNYQFGQWDPHHLDIQGRYRRFVMQGVTVDAIFARVGDAGEISPEEALVEAAVVLAGTILMASGVSGGSPGTYDSSTTLATLVPRIAAYRDQFYERQLALVPGAHGERLRTEAKKLRQPFGGARQHLNRFLARLRATQLQHVLLAQLFARMGFSDASRSQARIVPVVSARMLCEIDCRLFEGHRQMERGQLKAAAESLPQIEELLRLAIGCGALVDPWNILGFGGQFSLFPALENSVRDHRVDVLIRLMERVFALYGQLWKEAAAAGESALTETSPRALDELVRWWDQFAAPVVGQLDAVLGAEAQASAGQVAQALTAWRAAGEAAGDIAFWRGHVAEFGSARAFGLVVETLLDKHDPVAAMALLMHWLSQVEQIPLEGEEFSFRELALRWMSESIKEASRDEAPADGHKTWPRITKFFDYLEANADEYWQPPRFELGAAGRKFDDPLADDASLEDEDDQQKLYGAAYDEMTYRDSTRDGVDSETLDGSNEPTDYELDYESQRIEKRLDFLSTVAHLWQLAAAAGPKPGCPAAKQEDCQEVFQSWLKVALENKNKLEKLLAAIHRHRIPDPRGNRESLVEYDRRRAVKQTLLEHAIGCCVEMCGAAQSLFSASRPGSAQALPDWERQAVEVLRAIREPAQVRALLPELVKSLEQQPLLYVPLGRNGDPQRIVAARNVQQALLKLLGSLPKLGLFKETCMLIDLAHSLERKHPVGPGAVTQFDRLFEAGYTSIVESLVRMAEQWDQQVVRTATGWRKSDEELVNCLQSLTEPSLQRWLQHGNSLRLSALEPVSEEKPWRALVVFIERYGRDLFTPRFLNAGNLRAILHQGVDTYLNVMQQEADPEAHFVLLDDLDKSISRVEASGHLRIVLEALLENQVEFHDYNNTTTQSDRGDMLHVLLDFLRLKAAYQRIEWNLRPVVLAHEILVRRGRLEAAQLWRRALAERTREVADRLLAKLRDLTSHHGVRLTTIADHLEERFIQPLAVAHLTALVAPAMEESRSGAEAKNFAILEREINLFTKIPQGVGVELPHWLAALQEEVAEQTQSAGQAADRWWELPQQVPQVIMSPQEIQSQLKAW